MDERGRANGLIFGGVGLGSALAPPLLTVIILRFGWHMSFWFCAVLGVLAGVGWDVTAGNTPEEDPWGRTAGPEHIASGRGDGEESLAQAIAPAAKRAEIPWAKVLGSKDISGTTGSYLTYG